MSNLEERISNLEKDFVKNISNELIKKYIDGGMFVIDTLRGAMKASDSNIIFSLWLDTCEKELRKKEKKLIETI